jgi:hypothetical protein
VTTTSENNLDVKNLKPSTKPNGNGMYPCVYKLTKGDMWMSFIVDHQTTDLGENRVKITGPNLHGEVHYFGEVVSLDRGRIIWSLLISEGWQRNRYVAK